MSGRPVTMGSMLSETIIEDCGMNAPDACEQHLLLWHLY
jgi:hypothetical protein